MIIQTRPGQNRKITGARFKMRIDFIT